MVNQVGPQKLIDQLKAEAPRYAKFLPELPRLMVEFLKQRNSTSAQERSLQALLEAQQRTNKLLQGLIYSALGFTLGLFVMQLVVRVKLF